VFLCGVCDFKNTKIKVTYSTRNTLKKLLMGKHHHSPQQSKYERLYFLYFTSVIVSVGDPTMCSAFFV